MEKEYISILLMPSKFAPMTSAKIKEIFNDNRVKVLIDSIGGEKVALEEIEKIDSNLIQKCGYDYNVIENFENLCINNQIECKIHQKETGDYQNCALEFLITIATSPEIWQGMATSALYEIFKISIKNIIKSTKTSKQVSSMKIVVDNKEFIVEKEELSEEIILEALNVFSELVSNDINDKCNLKDKNMKKEIVFPNYETGKIEVLDNLEFIRTHVAKFPK